MQGRVQDFEKGGAQTLTKSAPLLYILAPLLFAHSYQIGVALLYFWKPSFPTNFPIYPQLSPFFAFFSPFFPFPPIFAFLPSRNFN